MSSTAQDQVYDRLVNELAYKYSGSSPGCPCGRRGPRRPGAGRAVSTLLRELGI